MIIANKNICYNYRRPFISFNKYKNMANDNKPTCSDCNHEHKNEDGTCSCGCPTK